jgi:4'-phosphopantetheinyl transferase EntD
VIERILPDEASAAEAFADSSDVQLFRQEHVLVARAIAKRQREFATARDCARRALVGLGIDPLPIMSGKQGEPQWPPGIVGSISHCAGYRAAAVARSADVLTIGLDAEPANVLPDGVLELISLPAERARLRDLAVVSPGTHWDRVLFSSKEATYKAWFPLTRRWLGFEDAEITIDAALGTFHVQLLVPGPLIGSTPLTEFSGRWLTSDGLVLTAVTAMA